MLHKLDAKLTTMSMIARRKMESFMKKEDGAVDIVAIVVLIGIVVIIAVVFRKAIANLISNLFNAIGNNANKVINNQDI